MTAHLDEALAHLSAADRDALVLRFLQEQPLTAVSAHLGVTEETAKKRVSRAVLKLRRLFFRKGFVASAAVVTSLLASIPAVAAPVNLASTISAGALAAARGAAVAGSSAALAHGAMKAMLWVKLKFAGTIAAATVVFTAGGVLLIHTALTRTADAKMAEIKPPAANTRQPPASPP